MKKNLILIARSHRLYFKTLLYSSLLVLFIGQLSAQRVSETISHTISVDKNTDLNLDASQLSVYGSGAMNMRHRDGQYVLAGKNEDQPMLLVNYKRDIHTWEEDQLKLVLEVSVEGKDAASTQAILQELQPKLRVDAANQVDIDFFGELERFKISNGWFRDEDSKLEFKNGTVHGVKFIEISSHLYVPKSIDIHIKGKQAVFNIDHHTGEIVCDLEASVLNAVDLNKLGGTFSACVLNIDKLNFGNVNFTACTVDIKNAETLILESTSSKLNIESAVKLTIKKAVNDKCYSEWIDQLQVSEGLFSTFEFGTLGHESDMRLLNSDVSIKALGPGLSSFKMTNKNGELVIGTKEMDSSILTLENADLAKLNIDDSFIEIEKSGNKRIYKMGDSNNNSSIDISCELCTIIINR